MTLDQRLADMIRQSGPIGFARFMEVALYDPEHGFYATGGGAGRRRDFLTSPEVGPLFGYVVGRALDRWWSDLGRPDPFFVIEAGAGPGSLARGILHGKPRCAEALRYVLVDRAQAQRDQHGEYLTLADPAEVLDLAPRLGPLVCSLPEMPAVDASGIVLANELLDNMPFDLLDYDPTRGWHEVLVDLGLGFFAEKLAPTQLRLPLHSRHTDADRSCRMPVQVHAQQWLRDAMGAVSHGRVVVFDYAVEGYPVGDREWLRTYRSHEMGIGPLLDPGTQDITADVAVDQLAAVHGPQRNRTQAVWVRLFGITELVRQGRDYWHAHSANPDVKAVQARSRITESEALLDADGLGAFRVLEWLIPSS